MLVLSNDDLSKVVSYDEILDAIEDAYRIYEDGAYFMPHRIHVDQEDKNLLYMPCILDDVFGTKMLTIFPKNMDKGVPTLDGLMLLNDIETGRPTCLMDGKTLTGLRTGAAGGVGIRHTTPESVETVGLIGCGVQGFYQLLYACRVRAFHTVYLFDPFIKDLSSFISRLEAAVEREIRVVVCTDARSLVDNSDVVITATTASSSPIPSDPELLRGKHFVGIGSYKPHMHEFPDALYPLVDTVYIDADAALEETGDLITPLASGILRREQITRFGTYLLHEQDKDRVKAGTTLYKCVGMAIFDIVVANLLYKKALAQGIGYTM